MYVHRLIAIGVKCALLILCFFDRFIPANSKDAPNHIKTGAELLGSVARLTNGLSVTGELMNSSSSSSIFTQLATELLTADNSASLFEAVRELRTDRLLNYTRHLRSALEARNWVPPHRNMREVRERLALVERINYTKYTVWHEFYLSRQDQYRVPFRAARDFWKANRDGHNRIDFGAREFAKFPRLLRRLLEIPESEYEKDADELSVTTRELLDEWQRCTWRGVHIWFEQMNPRNRPQRPDLHDLLDVYEGPGEGNYVIDIYRMFMQRKTDLEAFQHDLQSIRMELELLAPLMNETEQWRQTGDEFQRLIDEIGRSEASAARQEPGFNVYTSLRLARGFPRGVADLQTLFDELATTTTSPFNETDVVKLGQVLEPLRNLTAILTRAADSWSKMMGTQKFERQSRDHLFAIGTILTMPRHIDVGELHRQISVMADECLPWHYLKSGVAVNLTRIEHVYKRYEAFQRELTKLVAIREQMYHENYMSTVYLRQMFEHYRLTRPDEDLKYAMWRSYSLRDYMDKVRKTEHLDEIQAYFEKYAVRLERVDFDAIAAHAADPLQVVEDKDLGRVLDALRSTGFEDVHYCMANTARLNFTMFRQFATFAAALESIGSDGRRTKTGEYLVKWIRRIQTALRDAEQAVKTFRWPLEEVVETGRNGTQGKQTPPNKSKTESFYSGTNLTDELNFVLNSTAVLTELTTNLSDGLAMLRELSRVHDRSGPLLELTGVDSSVIAAINTIDDFPLEYWGPERKAAIGRLVREVSHLNGWVGGADGNKKTLWRVFSEAQKIDGAVGTDAATFADPIATTLVSKATSMSLQPPALLTASDTFRSMSVLRLDYSSKTWLQKAADVETSIDEWFFALFNASYVAPLVVVTTEPPMKTLAVGSVVGAVLGIGLAGALLVIITVWVRRRNDRKEQCKRWKRRERFWSYIVGWDEHNGRDPSTNLFCAILNDRLDCVRNMCRAGFFVNHYLELETPLHAAVKAGSPKMVDVLIRHGARRRMMHGKTLETAEEVARRQLCEEQQKSPDDREGKAAGLERVLAVFEKHRNKKYNLRMPSLLPAEKFRVYFLLRLEASKARHFGEVFPDNYVNDMSSLVETHRVVTRGAFNDLWFDECGMTMLEFLATVTGPAMLVPLEWVEKCVDGGRELFHHDWHMRLTCVSFMNKIYTCLDTWKKFAAGRYIPYLKGISVCHIDDRVDGYLWGCLFRSLGAEYMKSEVGVRDWWKAPPEPAHWHPRLPNRFVLYPETMKPSEIPKLFNFDRDVPPPRLSDYTLLTYHELAWFLLAIEDPDDEDVEKTNHTATSIDHYNTFKPNTVNKKTETASTTTTTTTTTTSASKQKKRKGKKGKKEKPLVQKTSLSWKDRREQELTEEHKRRKEQWHRKRDGAKKRVFSPATFVSRIKAPHKKPV